MSIIQLAKFMKRKERGLEYFCTRCDASHFRILQTGQIYCVNCGALMRNLTAHIDKVEA